MMQQNNNSNDLIWMQDQILICHIVYLAVILIGCLLSLPSAQAHWELVPSYEEGFTEFFSPFQAVEFVALIRKGFGGSLFVRARWIWTDGNRSNEALRLNFCWNDSDLTSEWKRMFSVHEQAALWNCHGCCSLFGPAQAQKRKRLELREAAAVSVMAPSRHVHCSLALSRVVHVPALPIKAVGNHHLPFPRWQIVADPIRSFPISLINTIQFAP